MCKSNYLALSWSTSRGRDTYGYNICRLDDRATDKRYKCMGGGYDMVGTNVGHWLATEYQDRLLAAGSAVTSLYGARRGAWDGKPDSVQLDGACGVECMIKIAAAIGVRVAPFYNKRTRRNDGYFVTDYGNAAKMKAAE